MYRGREVEEKEETKKGFDLTVTHRDSKTGLVTKHDPYTLRVIDHERLWERPAGSGNLWDKENNPIGRWISKTEVIKGKKAVTGTYDPNAQHVAWEPPLTEDQKIAKENATLRQELAALKAEKAKTEAPPVKTAQSQTAQPPKKD